MAPTQSERTPLLGTQQRQPSVSRHRPSFAASIGRPDLTAEEEDAIAQESAFSAIQGAAHGVDPNSSAFVPLDQSHFSVSGIGGAIAEEPEEPPLRADIWVIMGAMWIGSFLAALDGTIVATIMNSVGSEFRVSKEVGWLGTSYLLTQTAFQPLYGRASDIFGRKAATLFASVIFLIGSLLCGLSQTFWQLCAARAIAGIGGGGLTTMATLVTSDLVSLKARGTWQGLGNLVYATGAALGGPLGGALADGGLGWRWAFLVQVPLCAVHFAVVSWKIDIPAGPGSMIEKIKRIDALGSLFHPSLPFVSKTNLLLPIMSKVTASGIIAGNISTQRVKLNNGVEIPQVALGVYKAPNDGSTENACKWAFDAGYRHIDSAARYMNEESVGRALAEWTQANNVPRSEIFITSKLWDADHDKAAAAIEDSLKKLQVEYMDMYLMHSPGTMGPEKRLEAWKALEEAVDAGKIKTIGVSNFDVEELDHLLANCRIKPAVNQIESHPFFAHEELREACIERGIHIQAYSPMAQGQALDRPEIKAIATKHGKTPAQILLKWGLAHGNIILPKSLTKHRIESNAQLFDFQLDNDDMDALDGLDEGLKVGKLGPPGTSQPASPGGTRPGSRRSSGSGGLSGNKLQMSSS